MKKKICRLFVIILAAIFLLLLAACGESLKTPDETTAPAESTPTAETSQKSGSETRQPEETRPPKQEGEHEAARFPGEVDSAGDNSFTSGSFSYAADENWSYTYGAESN